MTPAKDPSHHRKLQMDQEDIAVAALCRILERMEGRRVEVIAKPDRENLAGSACDAIIARGIATWALEHTRIYGMTSHPRRLEQLRVLRATIEPFVVQVCPQRHLIIQITVPRGRHVRNLKARATLIAQRCAALGGALVPDERRFFTVLPFEVSCRRDPSDEQACLVILQEPANQRDRMLAELAEVITSKGSRMTPYRRGGNPTVLVLDAAHSIHVGTQDRDFGHAVRRAAEAADLDEIYLAASGLGTWSFWPIKAAGAYPAPRYFTEAFLSAQYLST